MFTERSQYRKSIVSLTTKVEYKCINENVSLYQDQDDECQTHWNLFKEFENTSTTLPIYSIKCIYEFQRRLCVIYYKLFIIETHTHTRTQYEYFSFGCPPWFSLLFYSIRLVHYQKCVCFSYKIPPFTIRYRHKNLKFSSLLELYLESLYTSDMKNDFSYIVGLSTEDRTISSGKDLDRVRHLQ